MASVNELFSTRAGNNAEHTRRYVASGYSTESAAISAVHASGDCPSTIGDLDRVNDETTVDEISYDSGSGTSSWIATVRWKLYEPSSGLNYSFQIGGTTIERFQAISQTAYHAAGNVAMNNVGINFDGSEVRGVTLPEKSGFEFVIPARKPIADVDNAYVTAVADLYLTVNDATFATFPAGEVLFLGMNGSRVGDSDWQLYYRFARSPNLTAFTSGGISVSSKDGWEYLWAYYKPTEKTINSKSYIVQEPVAVFVAQVFEDGDFSGLEL